MKKFLKNTTKGFTLVEFIVIMSIFAIMVGVALFNFVGFRSNVITENLAHDIAITLRNIQVGGGASQSIGTNPEQEQYRGAYFQQEGTGFSKEIILFEDKNYNGEYDEGEGYDVVTIESSDFIKTIFGAYYSTDTNGINTGLDPEDSSFSGNIAVTFGRFSTQSNFSPSQYFSDKDYLVIQVGTNNSEGRDRFIVISRLGQISVQ